MQCCTEINTGDQTNQIIYNHVLSNYETDLVENKFLGLYVKNLRDKDRNRGRQSSFNSKNNGNEKLMQASRYGTNNLEENPSEFNTSQDQIYSPQGNSNIINPMGKIEITDDMGSSTEYVKRLNHSKADNKKRIQSIKSQQNIKEQYKY